MALDQTNTEVLFDLRTLEIHLSSGKVKSKQYEEFLTSLPDEASNCEASPSDSDSDLD